MAAQSSSDRPLQPLDIIFSCNVCQESIAELGKTSKNEQTLNNGRGPIANLWMTECAHVVCTKHIEGGAPPFHPAGSAPRAVCPVCVSRSNNHALRDMYAVGGYAKGEHDAEIPHCFFRCPPVSLDSNETGMDALRFQFLNLITYGISIGTKYRNLQTTHARLKEQVETLNVEKNEHEARANALMERNKVLERSEKERLEKAPEIRHYLRQFTEMKKELDRRHEDLVSLGYYPPRVDYSFQPETESNGEVKTSHVDISEQGNYVGTTDQNAFAFQDIPSASSTTLRPVSSKTTDDEDYRAISSKRQKISDFKYNPQPPQQPHGRPPYVGETRTMLPSDHPASGISLIKNGSIIQPVSNFDRSGRPNQVNGRGTGKAFTGRESFEEDFKRNGYISQDDRTGFVAANIPYMSGAIQAGDVQVARPSERKRARPEDDFDAPGFVSSVAPQGQYQPNSRATHRSDLPDGSSQPQDLNGNHRYRGSNSLSSRRPAYGSPQFGPAQTIYHSRTNDYRPYQQNLPPRNVPYRSPVKQQLNRPYTPSPQHVETVRQPGNSSVTSPFFRSQPLGERSYRNNDLNRSSSPLKQVSQADYRMAPPQRPTQGGSTSQPKTMNGLSFIQNPYLQSDHLSSQEYDMPRRAELSMRPQTPRNSQGLFVRPDTYRNSEPVGYSSQSAPRYDRPQPLPSATPSLASSLDVSRSRRGLARDIASVPGMKGAAVNDMRAPGGLFGPGRGVFSSAGRRSVRR